MLGSKLIYVLKGHQVWSQETQNGRMGTVELMESRAYEYVKLYIIYFGRNRFQSTKAITEQKKHIVYSRMNYR